MITNDYDLSKKWLDQADTIFITASNGLSIAEGYPIFADNDAYKKYFGKFREKYGTNSLIRGVFTPMSEADHAAYMRSVHQYLIDDYHGSEVMKDLLALVSDKPYFILTSNADTHFQINGFDEERIFEIEGNFDGLTEKSPKWQEQSGRFLTFIKAYAGKNVVLLELGIGSHNQLIKGPTMEMAKKCADWKYITMNMPQEIMIPDSLSERTIALTGDIGANLKKLL